MFTAQTPIAVPNDSREPSAPLSGYEGARRPLPRFDGYEVIREIGRGGMGVVYEAYQRSLNRHVALKTIISGIPADSIHFARFRREAKSAGRLNHPSIVPVHEFGVQADTPYFTMGLVSGSSLQTRLTAEGVFDPHEAVRIVRDIAHGIHYAHEAGVMHRDLKPANVLLDSQGKVHITDFGLAKLMDDPLGPTANGDVLGTPGYMAPEQAAGDTARFERRTDVYGLGAILYSLLTGRAPFVAPTLVETLRLVTDGELVAPRTLNPSIDRDLELIIVKSLQKSRDLRYATAADLARDLDGWLEGGSIAARSLRVGDMLGRVFGGTPNSHLLEQWGRLWIVHGLLLAAVSGLCHVLLTTGTTAHWPYATLLTAVFSIWSWLYVRERRKRGPIMFSERHVLHSWASHLVGVMGVLAVEAKLGMTPFTLAPVIALIGAGTFIIKAGVVSGEFYYWAAANVAAGVAMLFFPQVSLLIMGLVGGASFAVPGFKYSRVPELRRRATNQARGTALPSTFHSIEEESVDARSLAPRPVDRW